jgi:hypothetical protein
MDERMKSIFQHLRLVTQGCRDDMHEPDEQDVKARVVGTVLDNAHGTMIDESMIVGGRQEIVVIIDRLGRQDKFNLADLIALARRDERTT